MSNNLDSNYKNTLNREQKESVFLLSIGTFLEYFDLMLYVHMAVLLNELFFPQDNPVTAELFAIFTFCSTFVLRPVGGFIVGWVGDHIGRKNTIIITTLLMALCCITMANVKTYAEIGIIASIVIIICRILQGFTSMGEIVGAQLYLVETLKQPNQYICSSIVNIHSKLGGLVALVIAYIAVSLAFNWRIAFWIGAIIALVGLVARTKLRETPEFVDYKRRLKIRQELINNTTVIYQDANDIVDRKVVFAYFILHLPLSICFYVAYIYTASFMRNSLGMTGEEIINQNFKVNFFLVLLLTSALFFLKKHHPLKLARINALCSIVIMAFIPYWFNSITNLLSLTLLQLAVLALELTANAAEITCFKHIPLARRFTILAITFGVASTIGYGCTPWILKVCSQYVGHYALWVVYIPVITSYLWAIHYIKNLEINKGFYHNYPNTDDLANDAADQNTPVNYNLSEEYQAYHADCAYASALLSKIEAKNNYLQSVSCSTSKRVVDIKLVKKAIIFAKKWHDGEFRKTGEPFYVHPLTVALIATDFCFRTNVIVAAILHDVVEDSDCTIELLEKEFNQRIAQIIYKLTRIVDNGINNIHKLSVAKIMHNIKKSDDKEAMLIKQIDRLHNLETANGLSSNKQKENVIETLTSIIQHTAYSVDDLNINNKLLLEDKIYMYCKNIITKNLQYDNHQAKVIDKENKI